VQLLELSPCNAGEKLVLEDSLRKAIRTLFCSINPYQTLSARQPSTACRLNLLPLLPVGSSSTRPNYTSKLNHHIKRRLSQLQPLSLSPTRRPQTADRRPQTEPATYLSGIRHQPSLSKVSLPTIHHSRPATSKRVSNEPPVAMGQSPIDNNVPLDAPPPLTALTIVGILLTFGGARWRPKETDERFHLAVFRGGYDLQSRVLRIPDRVGFFYSSPGQSKEDQKSQGALFTLFAGICSYTVLSLMLPPFLFMVLGLLDPWHNSIDRFLLAFAALSCAAMVVMFIALYWFQVLCNRRTARQSN